MLTNARWLPTTVLLTPIVQILWDHSSAIANLVILEMVEHVKVSANWSFRSGKWTVTQVKCTMPLAHILKNFETNKPINHDLGRDNERDRQIHRYMYVNRNWKNKSQTGRQEENRTQRNITSDFEIYFHICFWFIFNWIFSIFVRCWRMHYGFSRLFSWCWLFKFCGIIPVRV